VNDVTISDDERLRRWRLVLGGESADGTGVALKGAEARMDAALEKLYGRAQGGGGSRPGRRSAGLGDSAPSVARWLGDIRAYFPSSVVQVMQKDAIERLNLTRLLLEPEMLEAVEPDVHLVGTLLSLNKVMPDRARESARAVVRAVVAELERRLAQRTRSAVSGALDRASRTLRPRRAADIDWPRTIRANLRNYLPEHGTVVPERLIGHGRRDKAVERDVVLCVDQSGSMAASVVYAGVFGAVLASLRSLRTSLVVFDTAVVDLTAQLHDPVELLFGTQLGGGTDIAGAVRYAAGLVDNPRRAIVAVISDFYEGGDEQLLLHTVRGLVEQGTRVLGLAALDEDAEPDYDRALAQRLADLGAHVGAMTPGQLASFVADVMG